MSKDAEIEPVLSSLEAIEGADLQAFSPARVT